MNLITKTVLIGSLFLIAMGFWGRVHIVIQGSLILKVIGVIGLIAGINLLLTSKK